jgi:hypothetical protein
MMKAKFNLFILLFTFACFLTSSGIEKKKEYHESWAVSEVQALRIVNKFGDVKIHNNGGNNVTIDVVITVDASTENRAERLLDQIDVSIKKSGSTLIAETEIDNDFKSQRDFSIDYEVNIPSDRELDISNKFGNTFVNELIARGAFDIGYGNLTAVTLNASSGEDLTLSLSYGKATVEKMGDAEIEIKYSKMNISEAGNLKVDSKYSVMTVVQLESIDADSKYDTFRFEEAGSVTANTKYTHMEIDELKKAITVESGYGSIKVDEVSDAFEWIDVTNSYGAVSFGISDQVSYDLKASCDYCDIFYNSSNFRGNRMDENHTKKVEGKIGDGPSTAKVVVNSRYGGIKLR